MLKVVHKLQVGQRVKIARGEGAGREGVLTSLNSRTGEAVIRAVPHIPMLTHAEYLEPVTEQYGMGGEGFSGSGSFGEDSGEPNTMWVNHPTDAGLQRLHRKPMFGKHSPIAHVSRTTASIIARKVGGKVVKHDSGMWHVVRPRTKGLSEEYGAGEDASIEAAMKYKSDTPGQEQAEMPYHKTIKTIKKFMKDKYRKDQ